VKRILYVVSTLQRTGPTNQLFSIIKFLDRNEFLPSICTLSPEVANSRWDDFVSLGVEVETLGMGRMEGALRAKRALSDLIARYSPDLVHSQGLRADSLSIAAGGGWPRLCTVRNLPQMDYPMKFGRLRGLMMARHHVAAIRRMSVAVGVSRTVSANLERRYRVSPVEIIANGADTDLYTKTDAPSRQAARQRLSLSPEEFVMVSVGALNHRKDPTTLIKALQGIGRPDFRVFFVGDGPLSGHCKAMVHANGNYRFPGSVDSVVPYLHAADLFVSASRSEGLPNSVLEAMACGLPVIISDIGPHRELLPETLYDQLLFSVGDDQDLAEKLSRVMASDLGRLGQQLCEHFAMHFSARAMSKRYQELYLNLIQG
jgi:glycosyltransferase involved in cell wall biosynthesis